ncbi:MAG: multifunctional CCA addition/repair protein [Candidatus Berkiella sp.]
MKFYLVGGAVRDDLLGLPVKERDYVVVQANPDDMIQQGFVGVGKSFPVFLHPDTKEEYALARTERKTAGGYHGFEFNTATDVTLEEDLARRDLTINAMAQDETGNIIDPYGGQHDLKLKLLRHVSPAFIEDPVRVLRVARFAARFLPLGFAVAEETLALMQKMVKEGEIDYLVKERVWKEMQRALEEPAPQEFIRVLRKCGALKVVLSEIDALYGVPQSKTSHPEVDTGIHIELVLTQAAKLSTDPEVRFAALVHDVGKALTPKELLPKHPHHEQKGALLVKAMCERLNVPKDYQALAILVAKYHGDCYHAQQKTATELLALFNHCDFFRRPERFEKMLLACKADFQGRPGFEDAEYPPEETLRTAFRVAKTLDFSAAIAQLSDKAGPVIADKISELRIAAIANALKIPTV